MAHRVHVHSPERGEAGVIQLELHSAELRRAWPLSPGACPGIDGLRAAKRCCLIRHDVIISAPLLENNASF